MTGGVLIDIVGGTVFKDDDQGDIEFEVVDWATEVFFQSAGEEEAGARVVGEIGVTGIDQSIDFFLRPVFQREIDVMSKHGAVVGSCQGFQKLHIRVRHQFVETGGRLSNAVFP